MSDTATDDPKTTDDGKEGDKGTGADDAGKRFSQDDMTRVATREKQEGHRAGTREVLEALGFNSLEDAKRFKTELDAAEDAKLSEADRRTKEAERREAAAQKADREAKQERLNARIERALLKANAPEKAIERLLKLVDVDDLDADADTVKKAVADLKKDMPQLFTSEEDGDEDDDDDDAQPAGSRQRTPERRGPVASDPGNAANRRKKGETSPADAARSRLERRHGSKLKKD